MKLKKRELDRRDFLRAGFAGFSCFLGGGLWGCYGADGPDIAVLGPGGGVLPPPPPKSNIPNFGPLSAVPDANGALLPPELTSRVVAVSDSPPVAGNSFLWHRAPDGGACYDDGVGGGSTSPTASWAEAEAA